MTLAPYPTTVFPKKTHTDLFLDFLSHHTFAHKVTVTRTVLTKQDLQFPARQRCGQGAFLQVPETTGYPKTLFNQHWRVFPPHSTSQQDMPRATIVLAISIYQIPCGTCGRAYTRENQPDTGPTVKWAQEVTDVRKWWPVSSSRACHGWDACDQLGRGAGCAQPASLQPAVHTRGLAHQVRGEQPEEWCRPNTIHLQSFSSTLI